MAQQPHPPTTCAIEPQAAAPRHPIGPILAPFLLIIGAWILAAAPGVIRAQAPAPTVTAVSPAAAGNGAATPITVTGASFVATPTV